MHISKLIIFAALAAWPFVSPATEKKKPAPAAETSGGRLTLADALARTLRRSPELAAFAYDERAAEARVLQAGIRPNPEAGLIIENVGGTRGRGPIADTKATLELSQLIELGGKRIARIHEAEAGRGGVRLGEDYFVAAGAAGCAGQSSLRKGEAGSPAPLTRFTSGLFSHA